MERSLFILGGVAAILAFCFMAATPQDEIPETQTVEIVKDKYGEEWIFIEQGTAEWVIRYKSINCIYRGKGTAGRDLVYFTGGQTSIDLDNIAILEYFFPDKNKENE